MPITLADRLAQRDSERFVGRVAELELFDELLTGDGAASVVHVHGPGGIGKSALLREVARRAVGRGWSISLVDGRELALAPGELEDVFTDAQRQARPLILLDTYERLSALDGLLRRRLLPRFRPGRWWSSPVASRRSPSGTAAAGSTSPAPSPWRP